MDMQQLTLPSIEPIQTKAKPFLKWAGGKSQLLPQLRAYYPTNLSSCKITKYVEPFIGGGAVFFDFIQRHPVRTVYLSDINQELGIAYRVVQQCPDILVEQLYAIEKYYKQLPPEKQKEYFYQTREKFNRQKQNIKQNSFTELWVSNTAMLIFLNRTCFNGLFRLNRKGAFNVPFGSYKNPTILNSTNIFAASQYLQNAEIHIGDFVECNNVVDENTFVYFDPPYRPLSKTASFTSYTKSSFNDSDQVRLAKFFAHLSEKGAKLMLSNSDPTNSSPSDTFFHQLYHPFYISTVFAKRMINRDGTKRGKIRELVITNYEVKK